MTKWVHLNWGDEGVKRLFHKCRDSLRPGGTLILEPQQWSTYKKKVWVGEWGGGGGGGGGGPARGPRGAAAQVCACVCVCVIGCGDVPGVPSGASVSECLCVCVCACGTLVQWSIYKIQEGM